MSGGTQREDKGPASVGLRLWAMALLVGGAVSTWAYIALAPPAPSSAEATRPAVEQAPVEPADPAQTILDNEAITKALSGRLHAFAKALLDGSASEFFHPSASVVGVRSPEGLDGPLAPGAMRVLDWSLSPRTASPDGLLSAYRAQIASLHTTHAEIEYGKRVKANEAESLFYLELVGTSPQGREVAGMAQLQSTWRQEGPDDADWKMTRCEVQTFYSVEAHRPLFIDALSQAVDPETRRALAYSKHEEMLLAILEHGPSHRPPHPFDYDAIDRHPGLAVVDINGDGLDDIYLMPRWGTNQLLVNQGQGRFKEDAATWGLDLENHCSSAIFADFDNDGDPDLMLGRTLQRSLYLINRGKRFEQAESIMTAGTLPGLVSSVSVVDVDGDGLLDVYFSTLASEMLLRTRTRLEAQGKLGQPVLGGLVRSDVAERLGGLLAAPDYQPYLSRPGPPNRLYRNLGGGRFEPVESALEVYRNTFQSTWSDYDGDGDQDVYVSNDHSANNLFRNDAGVFVDVTEETGTADIGFGMGVSWGDYDDDGRFDLYTSNMYSRAGRRMTGAIPGIDPRLARAARGNTLFRNAGERFEKTSSLGPEGLQVERAGWAWGAQFGDIDNDGLDDIYVLNGHYTAPEKVAMDHDS